jgi:Uma2 family endonuclease
MSYEDFLAWTDDKTYAEWVDGEIELMSSVADAHQDIAGFLAALLRLRAEELQAGRVLTAPFQMRLTAIARGREPDVMFVASERLDRITRTFLDGPAELAIEIVSPESALRDRGAKYGEYETAGVREYWIIDPDQQRADFFTLIDNRYERIRPDANGIIRSMVFPDFWIVVDWLWQRPMPAILRVLEFWSKQAP